jgi:hypothetical protein
LERPTLYLSTSPWKSSIFATWVAEIIISERLHYPVLISGNVGGNHDFYGKKSKTTMNSKSYNWEGLSNAYEDMTCSTAYRKSLPFPPDVQGHPDCAVSTETILPEIRKGEIPLHCKPCTHAMLDVWENQDAEISKYIYVDRVAEMAGPLGYTGGLGWYFPKSGVEKLNISTFRNLRDSGVAEKFGRLLTWGEYCYKVWKGEIPNDPPDELNSNGRRRRCAQADIDSANTCNVGSWVEGAPRDDSFCELFYMYGKPASIAGGTEMTEESCKGAKPGSPVDNIHLLCSKYVLTVQDIFSLLSPLAAELSSSRFSGINPLYSGYFHNVRDNNNRPIGTLAVGGCNWKNPGRPAGATWTHDYFEMVTQDGMQLEIVDYGAFLYDVHDIAARKATDENIYQPQLLFLGRPSPQMQRHKFSSNVRTPFTYNKREPELVRGGNAFKLQELKLAEWNKGCEQRRHELYAGHCPHNDTLLVQNILSRKQKNSYSCTNSNISVCSPVYDHCGYKRHNPMKIISSRLHEFMPEVHYFLRQMKLNINDLEYMLASAGYDTTFTAAENQNYAQRHAVCSWVIKNEERWGKWLPQSSSASTVRCLGEINYTLSGGNYIPGKMCNGHGTCSIDSSRGLPNSWAGKCICDRGYEGLDCGTLGNGKSIDVSLDNPSVLVMIVIDGFSLLTIVIAWAFVASNRNEPVIFYCSYIYVKSLVYSSFLGFIHLYFWIGEVTPVTCAVRPLLVIFPYLTFVGTIFARVYRTTQIMWGKTPPNKIVTDGESIKNIVSKVLVPQVIICLLWMLVERPWVKVDRLSGRPWERFSSCAYGEMGNVFAGVALAYILGLTLWSVYLLYIVRTSGQDPLYHDDSKHMSDALFIVVLAGACGVVGGSVTDMLASTFPVALIAKWILISIVTPICAVVGLYIIIFPKYQSIYINPEENIIFPGKLFQQQVIENNKMRQIFPTEDESSIDPRVLRKNKELLLENLELLEVVRTSSAEVSELDSLLKKYEEKRIERHQMAKDSPQTNKYNLRENSDASLLSRVVNEIEATHSEASHYLGEMSRAVQSEDKRVRLLESKKQKINKILRVYAAERKKKRTLQIASHNALPTLDAVLSYHNLQQYNQMFAKLKMTTCKLIQLQPNEIKKLPMLTGHQRKLQLAIKNLVGESPQPLPSPPPTPASSVISDAAQNIDALSVMTLLQEYNLGKYCEAFEDYGCVDRSDLLLLSPEDLIRIGLASEESIRQFDSLKIHVKNLPDFSNATMKLEVESEEYEQQK